MNLKQVRARSECQLRFEGGIMMKVPSHGLEVVRVKGGRWRTINRMRKDWNKEGFTATRITHFRYLSPDSFTVFILLDDEGPIGYAAWNFLENNEDDPTLRQIYIVPQKRRKGYGTYLFTESRKLFSDAPTMVVERPNSTFAFLMCKLGLAEIHGDMATGKGVMFL